MYPAIRNPARISTTVVGFQRGLGRRFGGRTAKRDFPIGARTQQRFIAVRKRTTLSKARFI